MAHSQTFLLDKMTLIKGFVSNICNHTVAKKSTSDASGCFAVTSL